MSLLDYAKKEMDLAGIKGEYDGMLYDSTLRIVEVFSSEGHSGMSAMMQLAILKRVLAYLPLTQLTGEADEWMDVSEVAGEPMRQNIRHSAVFTDGKISWDVNAPGYREPISFPYVVA